LLSLFSYENHEKKTCAAGKNGGGGLFSIIDYRKQKKLPDMRQPFSLD